MLFLAHHHTSSWRRVRVRKSLLCSGRRAATAFSCVHYLGGNRGAPSLYAVTYGHTREGIRQRQKSATLPARVSPATTIDVCRGGASFRLTKCEISVRTSVDHYALNRRGEKARFNLSSLASSDLPSSSAINSAGVIVNASKAYWPKPRPYLATKGSAQATCRLSRERHGEAPISN
eukprot:IDg10865t1